MFVSVVCLIVYVNKYVCCGSNYSMAIGSFGSHPSDCLFAVIADKSFKNVVEFKYFRMASTFQNCMQEEIKSRLNCGICVNIRFRAVFVCYLRIVTYPELI